MTEVEKIELEVEKWRTTLQNLEDGYFMKDNPFKDRNEYLKLRDYAKERHLFNQNRLELEILFNSLQSIHESFFEMRSEKIDNIDALANIVRLKVSSVKTTDDYIKLNLVFTNVIDEIKMFKKDYETTFALISE
ncbi:GGDEF domain-containing protein [Vibrio crassostreae]|nr:GGDEF domain-containing protein [Vibrio crassostreae]